MGVDLCVDTCSLSLYSSLMRLYETNDCEQRASFFLLLTHLDNCKENFLPVSVSCIINRILSGKRLDFRETILQRRLTTKTMINV